LAEGSRFFLNLPQLRRGLRPPLLWVRENVWLPREASPRELRDGGDTWKPEFYLCRWHHLLRHRTIQAMGLEADALDPHAQACFPASRWNWAKSVQRLRGRNRDDAVAEGIAWSERTQGYSTTLPTVALFFTRTCARLLRPKLAEIMPAGPPADSSLRAAFDRRQAELDRCCEEQKLIFSEGLDVVICKRIGGYGEVVRKGRLPCWKRAGKRISRFLPTQPI